MNKKYTRLIIIVSIISLFTIILMTINFLKSDYHSDLPKLPNPLLSSDINPCSISAQYFISDLTIGWNLGNSLDSCTSEAYRSNGTHPVASYETAWGNPVVTKELIDSISDSGFNAIRIPVTWYYNTYEQNNRLYIREDWLQRVSEVVQYALENDMYVILNSHHDAPIIWADMNDIQEVSYNVADLWTQIATYFKDYNYHLIFESYNEINTKNDSWVYSDAASNATNILNQLFINSVRSTGGNNADRILICGTFLNGTSDEILNSFILPSDSVEDRLLIEVHSYDSAYDQTIDTLFQSLDSFSKQQNVPVIIGEFGTTQDFVPAEYRAAHAGNFVARAAQYDLKCFWWDDGGDYKIIDRANNTFIENDILEALMNPVCFETTRYANYNFNSMEDYTYSVIKSDDGSLQSSSFGALTLNPDTQGLKVTPSNGYRIILHTTDKSSGLRLLGIAFYDSENRFISYTSANAQTTYDVTTPENAVYMKVSIYNPWGYRSKYEYQSYLDNNNLNIEITEYEKTS